MRYRCITEEPAGLAAFSLWVHGGPRCRPPISRMGNKAGYAHALGALAGIRAGEGAGAYVWAEADDDVRALLRAYTDADALRRIAEIIRGWADEEPRALWERLRAERKARSPRGEEGVAGWMTAGWLSYGQDPERGFRATAGGAWPDDPPDPQSIGDRCHALATYAQIVTSNRLIHVAGPDLRNTGRGGTTFGGEAFATPAAGTARGVEEVAGRAAMSVRTMPQAQARGATDGDFLPRVAPSGVVRYAADAPAGGMLQVSRTGWPPVLVLPRILPAADLAEALGTPGDLSGVLCYADPPYLGRPKVISPVFVAQSVLTNARDRAELDAALGAVLDHDLRLHVQNVHVMLTEVLGAVGAKNEVLQTVVDRVMVLVVDHLVWLQWAAKVALHDQAVLEDVASGIADHTVSRLDPPAALARATNGSSALTLWRGLWGALADLDKAAARSTAQLRQARIGTDVAITSWLWAALAGHRGVADLADDVKRHAYSVRAARLDTSTKYTYRGDSITGYAAKLSRDEVVRHALERAALGARVMVSESRAVEELVAAGWQAHEIGHTRRGQKRTFAANSGEVVTMNFDPVDRYERVEQVGLFR